jgi:hypothetical protein
MSEHDEQVTFFNWVRLNRKLAPNLEVREVMKLCYSNQTGANLPKRKYKVSDPITGKSEWRQWSPEGKWLREEGMTKGIPDIQLAVPVKSAGKKNNLVDSHVLCGLYIEMKFGGNKLTKEQSEIKILLEKYGYKVAVCYSAAEAVKAVFDYLPFKEKDYQGIKEFLK